MLSIVQSSWLSEEEFGMGHIDLKPATARYVLGKWNL
jgi:THO complex subunit 2